MKTVSYLIFFLAVFCSCGVSSEDIKLVDYTEYRVQGNKLAKSTQATLLSRVASIIQEKGMYNAIDYCNVEAFQITDSMSVFHECKIQRITDKNRNPNNALKTNLDNEIWSLYKEADVSEYTDTLIIEKEFITFYKPITIAMPTCLKCHGMKEHIDIETKTRIASLYPHDLAVDYKMNDLRGLWKISWKQDQTSK